MKKICIAGILLIFVIAGGIILRVKTNEPPDIEIMRARKILSEAQLEGSPGFAPKYFKKASADYDLAMAEWKNQNSRWIVFRDYAKVRELANTSAENSKKAINEARKNITDTKGILNVRIQKLDEKIKKFEEVFNNFPMSTKHRNEMVKCRLLYSEGKQAFQNKNYNLCKSKLDSVELIINEVFDHYQIKLTDYFKEFPAWNENVKQTVNYSKRSKTYAIIVDKLARELMLYKNGEIYKRIPVELGANWVGDKQWQGDKSTPEGLYKIIDKKQNGQTMYYKALLLDYPNEEDKKRFARNKRNGLIMPGAKIGGLIEIHGNGGKGIDWTDGCIALKDSDMDVVFSLCPVNTKVTVVGSVKSFDELFGSLK